ncbi:MAG: Hpt domain-containing protein [Hyphomicrobium sp.]|uniref:Hpt domain-containing protein n=1 Tax=Hyphomicrobium sp. TaxID=82 RepID=UPI003D0F115B
MGPLRQRTIGLRRDSRLEVVSEPPAAVMGHEPIDRAHLGRYTLGSPLLEREILGLFLAQLPLSIEQLRFAATDREWQIAAHTIKGSAKAVGAAEIAVLALEAEQTSGIADEEERDRLLARLESAFETVQSYVDEAFPPEHAHS